MRGRVCLEAREKRAVERFRRTALQLWDESDYRVKLAEALHALFPSAVKASVFDVDGGARIGGIGHTVGGRPSSSWDDVAGGRQVVRRLRRFGRHEATDPWANVPVTTRQLYRGEPEELERARELGLWPNGAHYQLRAALYSEGSIVGHIAVMHARTDREFTERHRGIMQAILPAVIEGMAARKAIGDKPLDAGQLGVVLDAFDEPALLCTSSGVVCYANRAGRRVVDQVAHWLPAAIRGEQSARQLARLARIEHDGRSLYLVIPHAVPCSTMRWELPPRLAQVADLLARGLKDREIAESLGVSPHSVRTYVTRVYYRLGISSRVELARLAVGYDQGGLG